MRTSPTQSSPRVYLPCSPKPRVSIVIPTRQNPSLLHRSLTALERHVTARVPAETIVIANGPTAETVEYLHDRVSGAQVLESTVNLGFAGGCRYAASVARGEYLVLLNDDAEIQSGWLEALVEVADTNPRAGAVGSRILFVDGRLQEAGCILWRDGSTVALGRGLPARTLGFTALRRVDYCSGCSLLVRKSLWDALGGFTDDYYPAYYEDVELCLRLRALGHDVFYAPHSVVLHHESQSTHERLRVFLNLRNRARFLAKWAPAMIKFSKPNPESSVAVERELWRAGGCLPKVLIVDDRLPDPKFGSGHGRMLNCIRELGSGTALSFWAADQEGTVDIGRFGAQLVSEPLETHLAEPGSTYSFVIVSRPHNWERFAGIIQRCQPHAALVYDAEALFHRRLERELKMPDRSPHGPRLGAEAAQLKQIESTIRTEADWIVSVSSSEADFFWSTPGHARVSIIPAFCPTATLTEESFSERSCALFAAGWRAGADSPNGDALRWFASEILPLVRLQLSSFRLLVTGDRPANLDLPIDAERVISFLGPIDDIKAVYRRVLVAVVPVRYGSGVTIKTIEAIQYGIPVISTTLGVDGLEHADAAGVEVADSPEAFARALVALITDEFRWNAARNAVGCLATRWTELVHNTWRSVLEECRTSQALEFAARAPSSATGSAPCSTPLIERS